MIFDEWVRGFNMRTRHYLDEHEGNVHRMECAQPLSCA